MISCSLNKVKENQSCEKEFSRDSGIQLISNTKEVTGSTVSYLLTGATYAGEFAVKISAGIIIGLILCSPSLAIDGLLLRKGQRALGECFQKLDGDSFRILYKGETWGEKVYKQTKSLGCPIMGPIIKSVKKVVGCYISKNTKEDRQKAKEQMTFLMEDKNFIACTSIKEKKRAQAFLDSLN